MFQPFGVFQTEVKFMVSLPILRLSFSIIDFSGIDGFCIFLYRLANAAPLRTVALFAGLSVDLISRLFNTILEFIYSKVKSKLEYNRSLLNRFRIQLYVDSISAMMPNNISVSKCFGFIDGTFRPACRPVGPNLAQMSIYNGNLIIIN